MNQPLISKKADGSYELSETGLNRAYMMTMQRLLVHYAQQALKTPPADAQVLGQKLPAFIAQVIKKARRLFRSAAAVRRFHQRAQRLASGCIYRAELHAPARESQR
jgi:hypothetical protein